jgi:hypothetical protein
MDQLLAFAAVVAAFTAVSVSVYQARLQNAANKHSLYEKRIRVYLSIMHFLSVVAIEGRVDLDKAFVLLRETNETEFLFGPEVQTLVEEIYQKGIELRTAATLANANRGNADLLAKYRAPEDDLTAWLTTTARDRAKQSFRPYLRLVDQ